MSGAEPTKFEEWSLLMVEHDCILERAKGRFMEEFERREDWKAHESRYHVYKAHDQLSVASYHARQDEDGAEELVKTNLADCLNHVLMAMAAMDVDRDECEPVTDMEVIR
jgi:adenylate kinase family enzyme